MRKRIKEARTGTRVLILAVFFLLLSAIFAVILFTVQYKGWKNPPDIADKNIKTVTVKGMRGEIYDRNGKLLVGNSSSYNVIYEYGAMPYTYKEINAELLALHSAIEETGNRENQSKGFFPFSGIYPNLYFLPSAGDKTTDVGFYLNRVLSDDGLEEDISAEDLVEYLADKYKLSPSLYSDSQIHTLLCLWYDMERVRFGAFQAYTVAENVSQDLINRIEESGISGATVTTVTERVYHYPGIASHILGQVGKIDAEDAEYYTELGYPLSALVGKSGCEEAFEKHLRGQDGTMVIRYDDSGNVIEKYYEKEPVSGNDVYLTIDIDLQIAAEEGLKQNIAEIEGTRSGALTAMDPRSGDVLAIASYPTYDLTRFGSAEYVASLNANTANPWLNRALNGVYAPGSVYKIGVALAALETGAITESTEYTCNRVFPYYHKPTCLGNHGATNVVDAIEVSCNVFFYYVGEKLGLGNITPYTCALGLGVSTGIELPEKTGSIAGPQYSDAWKISDNLPGAIGQSEHGYTPLQLSVYMSSVINGGTRYRAHLLDSVRAFYTGEPIYTERDDVMETVSFSDSTYSTVMEGMKQVVTGSNRLSAAFRDLPVTVGGKTGTAEVDNQKANALLSCFAPFEAPEIVVSCIIEEGESGSRASTAVARVLEKYFEEN